ncbi:PAP2 superfamily protein [Burkholderia multivorans]|nr:PAP2 superfamily protein [Burkholderia multivorans]
MHAICHPSHLRLQAGEAISPVDASHLQDRFDSVVIYNYGLTALDCSAGVQIRVNG